MTAEHDRIDAARAAARREARKPTRCHICKHRERAAIDLALARHVAVSALSKRYQVSVDCLYRHAKAHMPAQLRAQLIAGPSIEGLDLDKLRETESQSLLANLIALRQRLFAALDLAEENGNDITRISSQIHKNMEIVGHLLGDLASGSSTITNILIAPQYVQMRVELVKALAPYPEARQAVAQVLHTIEHRAAEDIKADKRELAA